MSHDPIASRGGAPVSADTLLASASIRSLGIAVPSAAATRDLFLSEHERVDDDVRGAFTTQARRIVDTIATDLISFAGRTLVAAGQPEAALALGQGTAPFDLLAAAGLLDSPDLVGDMLGRIRLDALANRVSGTVSDEPDRPSLLARLVDHPDRVVSHAARGLLAADSRRRDTQEGHPMAHSDLSAECQHRLTWQVAAALRTRVAGDRAALAALDRALAESARRSLRSYDEGERTETAAMRLASALDPAPGDLGALLLDAIADRRLILLVALLARALATDFAAARAIVLDRDGDRLLVALRALDLPRPVLARIGFALCEADPRRDLDRFVDRIDPAVTLGFGDARAALDVLRGDPVYRATLATLATRGVTA